MPLTNGQTFAGYTIIRLLGSGGMGEVYLAQHPRLPRRDALKLLPHDWSADAEYRARFNREADLASTLWHPHIVGVHDRGEEDGQLWISMDFVDGLDAAKLLSDRYPVGMPVEEVARIVTAVASALDYAHKQGLLHRDVKPANIMITHLDDEGEQRILLTDFGIARNVNDISGLTKTNMTVGTVAYASPEQLLGEDLNGRTDQYSLAATAYHLLTGSQLFPNSNPAVVISRHLNVPPPALADHRPELGKLDPVLAIGLAKRPDDRFERCADFARALSEQINPGVPTTSAPTAAAPRARPAVGPRPPHGDSINRNPLKAASPESTPPIPTRGGGIGRRTTIALIVGAVILFAAVLAVAIPATLRHQSSPTTQTTTAQPVPNSSQPVLTTTSSLVPSSSALARPTDYTGLLIHASDINAPIAFTGSPPTQNPNGQPGAATTFKDDDGSHVIKDTIQVFDDTTAATNALKAAKGQQGDVIKNPATQAANVGTGGTTLLGHSMDGSKGITVLLFTEGRAFVTMEFDGPADIPAPADFVADLGQKQDSALKTRLSG
jgi:serine/threonine-protein kinase